MKRIVSTSAAALLFTAADLAGQAPAVAGIEPGTRVRVTGVDRRVTGDVAFADADSVVVATEYGRSVLPAASIRQVEVSNGRDWFKGALEGAATGGLAAGAVFGGLVLLQGGDAGWTGLGAAVGAVLGAPVGFIIGGLSGSERWEHHFPTAAPAASGGVALGLSIPLG
ncbi:MAG TPA: hypothetical protein VGC13_07550 [Longimicrobium sp.]|uniref:hypothetical protein n=1 Tax=Longimicrobium sp. TaxID=2029185 RepID=UPI002EDA61D9